MRRTKGKGSRMSSKWPNKWWWSSATTMMMMRRKRWRKRRRSKRRWGWGLGAVDAEDDSEVGDNIHVSQRNLCCSE
jgi:hypothetical protein